MSGKYFIEFADGRRLNFSVDLVRGIRSRYFGDADLAGRVSSILITGALGLNELYGINLLSIFQPILDLENGTNLARTKRATPFRGEVLKGLWHKHWSSARFMPPNIMAGWGKNGLQKMIIDVVGQPDGSKALTEEHVKEIARRSVEDPLTKRSVTNTLTGEWIVYLPRGGKNYYLTCEVHQRPDELVFENVIGCEREFPDLQHWLREARASA